MNYELGIGKIFFPVLIFSVLIFLTAFKVFAVDRMKTTEQFAASSDAVVSGPFNSSFTLFIGDNLSGVTNPVKSLYFKVSGVYTGGGTLALSIDSDGATTKIFTLPSVSGPTPFEILYKDPSNKINPTSAGSYQHALNVSPSGVTVYGFGAKLIETHRYAPLSCDDGQPSNEKVKTTEQFAASSDAVVSGPFNSSFTLFIGDNLSGVTNPVKSLYFKVSGVYTGGGTLALSIDSDGATTKIFTLPSVSGPTPFEILYKDPSNKINPTSAGSYQHALNVSPSGVTVYGFGAKLIETHRYKPPTCGGYPATGELISRVFDTGTDGAAYNSIMWKGALGGPSQNQGRVRLKIATSDNDTGPWEYRGPETTCSTLEASDTDWYVAAADTPKEIGCYSYHTNKRYFRYKVQICSDDCLAGGSFTPQVDDIVVSWSP